MKNAKRNRFILRNICITTFCIFVYCNSLYAETSFALKGGYVKFSKTRPSEYEGNNIYDSEFFRGAYLRYKNSDNNILRLDFDLMKSGDEYYNTMPIAYEGTHIKMRPLVLSIGQAFGSFYALAGIGEQFNSARTFKYDVYPFSAKLKNSFCYTLTLGAEKNITKNIYLFTETRYLHTKADLLINGEKAFTENLSNTSYILGIGIKF